MIDLADRVNLNVLDVNFEHPFPSFCPLYQRLGLVQNIGVVCNVIGHVIVHRTKLRSSAKDGLSADTLGISGVIAENYCPKINGTVA